MLCPNSNNATAPIVPDHELLKCIGRGSYGQVWLARMLTGTWRAVKVVWQHPGDEHMFKREYEGLLKYEPLSRTHATHVAIFHAGRCPDRNYFYYSMELADDLAGAKEFDSDTYEPATLKSRLRQCRHLPASECIRIGIALASALDNLHKNKLVHRDVKPSNIIFINGEPKLADIGLVTCADASASFVGTEGYAAPEGPGSTSSDLYSLGKVLYEISTGQNCKDFPELPTDLPGRPDRSQLLVLNDIFARLCHRNPRKRYASAAHLHADLLRAASANPKPKWRSLPIRRTAIVFSATAAAIALGFLLHARLWETGGNATKPPEFLFSFGSKGTKTNEFMHLIGLASDSSNSIYASDSINNRISRFDSNGQFLGQWGVAGHSDGQLNAPCAITTSSSGEVYVCESSNHRISVFTTDGVFIQQWGLYGDEPGDLKNPYGIAIDSHSHVFVAERENHRISKFRKNGRFIQCFGSRGTEDMQMDSPSFLAIDSSDILYVADSGNDRILKFSCDGLFLGKFGKTGSGPGQFRNPIGLAVNKEEKALYVTEQAGNRVQKLTLDGQFIVSWELKEFQRESITRPTGIALMAKPGRIYVADGANLRVQAFH